MREGRSDMQKNNWCFFWFSLHYARHVAEVLVVKEEQQNSMIFIDQ